ncbi:MAG: DUF1302 domain-containing protein [Desulfobacterales bacterium]|nr:DUF1302 domain-containing protein [Desulfobacterales bacterium]
MKIKYLRDFKVWLMVLVFLFAGAVSVQAAGYSFMDGKLSIGGFLRQQINFNMGHINPYNSNPPPNGLGLQTDKNSINLCRTWLILEFDYRPTNDLRFFAKLRGIYDQTNLIEDDLAEFDALALSTKRYGTTMRLGEDEHITGEVWELYGDVDLGDLWMRFGRQQIVWGEMVSARILDIVNPLDKSWHFVYEPEEYENIRIPLWMARAIYTFERPMIGINDLYIEGFYNPGDFVPTNMPQPGNPYNTTPSAGEQKAWVQDRRGDHEFGFRVGGRIGQVGFTLNYAYLYTDDGYEKQSFMPPGPPSGDFVYYPQIDVYGISLNYAFGNPINIATSLEVAHYPDMPWQLAMTGPPPNAFPALDFTTVKQTDIAIRFQRFTRVFPFLPQMMNFNLQYQVRLVDDHEDLKIVTGPAIGEIPPATGNRTEKEYNDAFALSVSQTWNHNTYKAACTTLWQPDGGYSINPSLSYSPGDHWRFMASLRWWGGNAFDKATKGWLSYFTYQDEAMLRVTYQF